jgi:hypothetical protein
LMRTGRLGRTGDGRREGLAVQSRGGVRNREK